MIHGMTLLKQFHMMLSRPPPRPPKALTFNYMIFQLKLQLSIRTYPVLAFSICIKDGPENYNAADR